ncbi:uncharacterized protein NFIA_021520 [Aspergillus fischeri NRRL 181]|uniref:Uncharacterized protein n=1 Tax=Neosartorya fischeri (strain ATCC 1020 / DSM 3700 / CBS 544.65 / FGSC A1164 / JCM 1740 / NRRL 181 / WB 181) TaxID=331117 RepID=A1D4V0_NEOFI|nr:uncharacterized protein NFIA_021520 [Aspergillus fischeri NRRL 181]EAW23443.1 hypothetical protein NFIA_021520 [Aspergillus fischeri NRRL 181]KAG2027773.1 hypothetical protein GB937_000216 [Aspergillus fischeri]
MSFQLYDGAITVKTDTSPLTYNEAHLLTAGVVRNQAGRLLAERLRLSAADRDLTHRAVAAATTEEMKAAWTSAQAVQRRWNTTQNAAAEALSDDDIRNIRYAMRVPWQEHVLRWRSRSRCMSSTSHRHSLRASHSANFQARQNGDHIAIPQS